MAHKLVAMFVRHGSTTLNGENKFRGPMDVDLDDAGKADAKQLSQHLKGHGVRDVFDSGMKRSKQTARIAMPGKKSKTVKELEPFNIGDFAGQPKNEENMKKILHYQNNPDEKIPGGETLNEFRNRVNPKIDMAIRRGQQAGRPTVVFGHSSTIHQVGHHLHGDHNHVKVKPGGIVGVFHTPKGYEAKAMFKQSHDEKDKHMVS